MAPGGRCTNSGVGPTWDNPKLRHFNWSLSPSADSTAYTNYAIQDCPRRTDPIVSATAARTRKTLDFLVSCGLAPIRETLK